MKCTSHRLDTDRSHNGSSNSTMLASRNKPINDSTFEKNKENRDRRRELSEAHISCLKMVTNFFLLKLIIHECLFFTLPLPSMVALNLSRVYLYAIQMNKKYKRFFSCSFLIRCIALVENL